MPLGKRRLKGPRKNGKNLRCVRYWFVWTIFNTADLGDYPGLDIYPQAWQYPPTVEVEGKAKWQDVQSQCTK